jgi:glycosyltransferase involved in cell wall biosynthesis
LKKKVLIYSDCYTFGGSEHLISILIKNPEINAKYDIYYSYRSHKSYNIEVKKNYLNFDNHLPVFILTVYPFFKKIDTLKTFNFLKYIFKTPFLAIQKTKIFEIYNSIYFCFLIIKVRPEIIHINNGGFPGADSCNTFSKIAKLFKINSVIYQINNTIYESIKLKKELLKISRSVKFFIVASSDLENSLKNYFGISSDKICRLYNTINENTNLTLTHDDLYPNFNISKDDFLICSVGFLIPSKGHIYLIKAINHIQKTDINLFSKIKVIIIGNGPEFNNLNNYIIANNLDKTVYLLGYRSNVDDFINLSDLFVFPSISDEDMPLVILSAMKFGKLILSTSIAGIKEQIVNEESGILVSPDIRSLTYDLSKNIIKIMNNNSIYFSVNARNRYINLFSNIRYSKSIIDLYNKC